MRIIAGEYRGRRLLGPAHPKRTRPITDRVKTALFDRLAARGLIEGATVLDCFAGTGSMGIECLSRGAGRVIFVERDRAARRRLSENLAMIDAADRATVLTDALSPGLPDQVAAAGHPRRLGLLMLDPPYAMLAGRDAAAVARQADRLAKVTEPDGLMILRTEQRVAPPSLAAWTEPESHPYGSMTLHWYTRVERR